MRFKPNRGLRKKGTEDNSVHFVGIQTHKHYCAEMYMQNLFNSEINSKYGILTAKLMIFEEWTYIYLLIQGIFFCKRNFPFT